MAARRISYISFLVLIATLATASNADGLSYCNSQHLLEHCIGEVTGQPPVCRCVHKKMHNKAPRVLQSLIATDGTGAISKAYLSPLYTGRCPDIRSEIADKNRILKE